MIKAWRCKPLGVSYNDPVKCKYKDVDPLGNPYVKRYRKCGECDAEPVAVVPWDKHEDVQAVLAAAEKALMPFADVVGNPKEFPTAILEEIPPGHLPYGYYYEAAKALTKIRRING